LVVSFQTETRIFRFDSEGEVEEVEQFLGMSLNEQTLIAESLPNGRVLQVTESKVLLLDVESGIVLSSWQPGSGVIITAASSNQAFVLVSADGKSLTTLDLTGDLSVVGRQDFQGLDQVSCVHIPARGNIVLAGFWKSGSLSMLRLPDLEVIHSEILRSEDSAAVPRSIVLTQILPEAQTGQTLLVAMSDGIVLTYTVDKETNIFSGKKGIVLGTQQAYFQVLARGDGLYNVFATSEHSSLIYGSEGRIVYSAITAEDAICLCPFDSKAYPDAIVIATATDVKISHIDTERRTHVRTLHVGETVRRIAYSESAKVFGIGSIQKKLVNGEEMVSSSFKIVDEVVFGECGKSIQLDTVNAPELVESVIRAQLRNAHGEFEERFIVGTGFLKDRSAPGGSHGRLRVFGLNSDRSPYQIVKIELKGGCRRLEVMDGKIFAALIKTVVVFDYHEASRYSATLEKVATYRTSTVPIDLSINGNIIAVADLMKSVSLVEYVPGKSAGEPAELVEIARHFQSYRATAVSHIEDESYLEADDESNLTVLRRNREGVTVEDQQRLEVTSEMSLGELVNKITKINVEPTLNAMVLPKAFIVTVSPPSIIIISLDSYDFTDRRLHLLVCHYCSKLPRPPHAPPITYGRTRTLYWEHSLQSIPQLSKRGA
jgi:DNA damage-binding protein 1